MITRRLLPALAGVALAAALAGCGRLGSGADTPAAPEPAASAPATSAPVDDAGILADLDAVDDALQQADGDAAAGDEAARTDDAP